MTLLEYVEDRGIRKTEVDGWYDTKCVEVLFVASFIVRHTRIRRRIVIVGALCAGIA